MAKPIPQRGGWLVEQIVRGRRACYGTSELLLGSAARALAADGAALLSLGRAPLTRRGAPADDHPPWWLRATFGWLRANAGQSP